MSTKMEIVSTEFSKTAEVIDTTNDPMEEEIIEEIPIVETEQPSVVSWGRSDFHGLLRKHEEDYRDGMSFFQQNGRTIVSIASNIYHTCAVTASGEVYTCGQNDQGQVTDEPDIPELPRPRYFESLSNHKITSVACGLHHTIFLTATGCALSLGGNDCGQLGHSLGKHHHVAPKVVNFSWTGSTRKTPVIITKIAAGDVFSLFLTTTGEVYGCGAAAYCGNPLINGSTSNSSGNNNNNNNNNNNSSSNSNNSSSNSNNGIINPAERIETLVGETIIQVVSGSAHALAVTNQSILYGWGSNKHCTLGYLSSTIDDEHQQLPKVLQTAAVSSSPASSIIGISAGYSHSIYWTMDGCLY
jgi:alpha-tubulin suppressor-like RCC1 family protein